MTAVDTLADLIQARPGASFPEIQACLGEAGYDTHGDYALHFGDRDDLVVWAGLSEALAVAVETAKDQGLIHAHLLMSELEVFLVHAADGGMLTLPIVRRPPRGGYKNPHWLPIVWHTGRGCRAKNCLAARDEHERSTP